jgi:hypothetical protein
VMSMPGPTIIALAAVALLMLKHMVGDFFLQTPFQYLNKGTYGHPGGLLHAGIHVALTPSVYLVIAPASLLLAGAIALGEFVIHYHVDWAKEQITRRYGLGPQTPGFWHALGIDQALHGLTYVAIVAVLVWAAS